MATTNDLKAKLSSNVPTNKNATSPQTPATGGTILDLVQKMLPQVQKALPKHLNSERLCRIVTTEFRRNPKLMSCTKESLLGALMLSAQLGLEPGPLGMCYYIPFKQECQFMLGYRGMLDLARRSGQLSVLYAETVYSNDTFEYQLGLEPKLNHLPCMSDDRGEAVCWYGVARFKDGGFYIKVMSPSEIKKHRNRSKSGNSPSSPWNSDFDEMAKKTVIRAMFKYLPISPELVETGMPEGTVKAVDSGDGLELDVLPAGIEG